MQLRALEHGTKAYGARYLRAGYTFSDEGDLRYALGWPWMIAIEPAVAGEEPSVDRYGPWPSNWAPALIRALALDWFGPMTPDTLKLCRHGEPLTREECVTTLRERFLVKPRALHTGALLLAVEAMFGPDLVVDTVVEALEAFSGRTTPPPVDLTAGLFMLGFQLLRLTAEKHDDVSTRLQRMVDAKSLPLEMHLQLDAILNGRDGAERSAQRDEGRIQKADLQHVNDDPAFVAKTLAAWGPPKSHETPMPRLMFLGGEAALDHELTVWKKYGDKSRIVHDYGDIRSPKIVALFAEIAHASKAKADAMSWLEAHREYALPLLRADAKRSPAAAAVSKKLGQ